MDICSVRQDFPILDRTVNGRKLIYLDNAATTQMPSQVLSAYSQHYFSDNANVHRGVHTLSDISTEKLESARAAAALFIGAPSPECVVFTSGTTDSVNTVARAWAENRATGDFSVVTTAMEHHSNYLPWLDLCRRHGGKLIEIPLGPDGRLDIDALKDNLTPKTILFAVTYVSNVTGSVNDVKKLIDLAHSKSVPVLIDAAQAAREFPISVSELDADFLCLSAHKMLGPSGVGLLYIAERHFQELAPFRLGGGMISDIRDGTPVYEEMPHFLEAGTPNIGGIVAFHEAIRYIEGVSRGYITERETMLTSRLREMLSQLQGVRVLGPTDNVGSCVSVVSNRFHPYDAAVLLDKLGVAVRSGTHCSIPCHRAFGVEGSLRFSPAFYNTEEEIDTAVDAFDRVLHILDRASGGLS
ncbi:MAG: cysteine desulfurase [Oscillospiraceae bacterium]|nr:cysteine desulfurase [Oscillospiraceae bacterium]